MDASDQIEVFRPSRSELERRLISYGMHALDVLALSERSDAQIEKIARDMSPISHIVRLSNQISAAQSVPSSYWASALASSAKIIDRKVV